MQVQDITRSNVKIWKLLRKKIPAGLEKVPDKELIAAVVAWETTQPTLN